MKLILSIKSSNYTFSVSGEIKLLNYEQNEERNWPVYADCKSVRMRSTTFETEESLDFVTIGKNIYSGGLKIDTILTNNFTVEFFSDDSNTAEGFVLNWNCLSQWVEWTALNDGTCREAMGAYPFYNGSNIKYRTKYRKSNQTCCKLNKYILLSR